MMDSEKLIIVNHISRLFAEYAAIFAIDGNFDEVLTQYSAVVELADALGVKPEPYKRFSEDKLRRIREDNGLFCGNEDEYDDYYNEEYFERAFDLLLEANDMECFSKECYITLLAAITRAWSLKSNCNDVKALYLSEYDKLEVVA